MVGFPELYSYNPSPSAISTLYFRFYVNRILAIGIKLYFCELYDVVARADFVSRAFKHYHEVIRIASVCIRLFWPTGRQPKRSSC